MARNPDRVFSVDIDGETLRLQVGDGGTRQRARLWRLAPVGDVSIVSFRSFSPSAVRENNTSSSSLTENTQNTQYSPSIPQLPAYAQWCNADHDEPVRVVGVLGERDGVVYLRIEGSQTGIPANEVEFFEDAAADAAP